MAFPRELPKTQDAKINDKQSLMFLLMLGLLCSVLALVSHRGDLDDFYYTPNAVYALNHPKQSMGFAVHFLDGGENCDIVSHSWGTSIPFEYTQSAVAHVLGTDFLSVYYFIAPALIGFLMPLALYYALSHFSDQAVITVIGTLITVSIVLLLGDTHRTFGNFSLTRAYQGKTLLLSVGIPLFVGGSISFFKSPSPYYWGVLFAVVTAMVGATTSTLAILPALALVLALAHLLASNVNQRNLVVYLAFFATFCYLGVYTLFLLTHSATELGVDSLVNEGWPTAFRGHLMFFVNRDTPLTPVVFVLFTLVAIGLTSGQRRKLLISWIIVALVLLLNPLVAPLVIRYLTSPNIYWRLFYILPFPLVVGISMINVIQRLRRQAKRTWPALAAVIVVLFVGAHFLSFSPSVFRYTNTTFHIPPTYKLPLEFVDVANGIVSHTPEGTMLAPPKLAGIIPMLSAEHPQVRIRKDGVRLWLSACGKPGVASLRIGASEFAGGNGDGFPQFEELLKLEGDDIRSIVIHKQWIGNEDVQGLLDTYHFTHQKIVGDYVTAWR